jgi:hypothetical protein
VTTSLTVGTENPDIEMGAVKMIKKDANSLKIAGIVLLQRKYSSGNAGSAVAPPVCN